LDTDLHGYHAELAKLDGGIGSVKARGDGPRVPFRCPQCDKNAFSVAVAFYYWDAALDLFLEESGLPIEDFFNEFQGFARCANCEEVAPISDLGKL